jgi:hypothetical protein
MQEITAEQYRLMSIYGEDITEDKLIKILFNKEKGQMTMKEIDDLDFTNFKMPESTLIPNLLMHKGVMYGKQDMEKMTFGFYADLLEQSKDIQKNLILIMTMLWRPVAKISYWNRLKAHTASKLLKSKFKKAQVAGFKLLSAVEYEIIPYDVMETLKRTENFETVPGSYAVYTTNFFLLTSNRLMVDSLRSLKRQLETAQLELTESLRKISQDGDGTLTSGFLQENEQ